MNLRREQEWEEVIQRVTKSGKKCCGLKEKKNLPPCMDDQKDEIQQYQEQITRETEELDNSVGDEQTRKRQNRKKTRKIWEEEWWLKIVLGAKAEERAGHIRKLYSALKPNLWTG